MVEHQRKGGRSVVVVLSVAPGPMDIHVPTAIFLYGSRATTMHWRTWWCSFSSPPPVTQGLVTFRVCVMGLVSFIIIPLSSSSMMKFTPSSTGSCLLVTTTSLLRPFFKRLRYGGQHELFLQRPPLTPPPTHHAPGFPLLYRGDVCDAARSSEQEHGVSSSRCRFDHGASLRPKPRGRAW